MLKPMLDEFPEEERDALCKPILAIMQYTLSLHSQSVLMTPREMQMILQLALDNSPAMSPKERIEVVKYFAYKLTEQFIPSFNLPEFYEKFKVAAPFKKIPEIALNLTPKNFEIAEMIESFLSLRESGKTAALGGAVIEGEPGIGKTELIIQLLQAHKFSEKKYTDDKPEASPQSYYYLRASLPPKQKELMLIKAFHEGAIVVYDEINASSSFEELLNRLLMGKGPDGKPAENKGFMLLATQNPATMAGRSKASEALQHRLYYVKQESYSEKESIEILESLGLNTEIATELTSQYFAKKAKDKKLCFRDLINKAKEEIKAIAAMRDVNKTPPQIIISPPDVDTSDEVDIPELPASSMTGKPKVQAPVPDDDRSHVVEIGSSTMTAGEHKESQQSFLTAAQIAKIDKMISQLQKEREYKFFSMNKSRKQAKIDALTELKNPPDNIGSLAGLINYVKGKYPEVTKGIISHRTRDFFDELESSKNDKRQP